MASILRKVGLKGEDAESCARRFRPDSGSDGTVLSGEQSLSDDRDEFTVANSQAGKLTFFEEAQGEEWEEIESTRSQLMFPIDGSTTNGSRERVTFEVTSAEKVQENKSNFVLYTILVTHNATVEKVPSLISKRYSDFDRLNKQLRKQFPTLMESVVFPKKKISGNFTSETIAQRSRSFEQYLSHIYALLPIRHSQEVANFFYNDDVSHAFQLLKNQETSQAIQILEKALPVQDKLLGDHHLAVVRTLCGLVVAYISIKNLTMAQQYSETALRCIGENVKCHYLIPLLETSVRVCWELGQDKQDLEARLSELKPHALDTYNLHNLEDVFMKEIS